MDRRIIDMTEGELRQIIAQEVAAAMPSPKEPDEWLDGIRGIARIFGCSNVTAQKIKDSGRIDGAIVQLGRKIKVNKRLALELANKNSDRTRYDV